MGRHISRYRTPRDIIESQVKQYYQGIVDFLTSELKFQPIPGFDGLPYWKRPIACIGDQESVLFNPYIPTGMSGPDVSLDVVIVEANQDSNLARAIVNRFPQLVEIR